jgi:hypothetical protein
MPPRRYSRYTFSTAVVDVEGRLFLQERIPFRFRALADTVQYKCTDGDTLQAIAGRYYQGLPRPAGLWWVLADFQPEPVFDPTVKLLAGQTIYVPSLRTVQELVFNDARRTEEET